MHGGQGAPRRVALVPVQVKAGRERAAVSRDDHCPHRWILPAAADQLSDPVPLGGAQGVALARPGEADDGHAAVSNPVEGHRGLVAARFGAHRQACPAAAATIRRMVMMWR